ncbi:MAG: hypothetical protein JXA30_08775 [Deltaproteobacteria bacterium]|nr:hypothetical protein [Deltaproteobacteria bacterium]
MTEEAISCPRAVFLSEMEQRRGRRQGIRFRYGKYADEPLLGSMVDSLKRLHETTARDGIYTRANGKEEYL